MRESSGRTAANMPRGLAVLVLAGAAPLASPQDMRGDCVSCADLRRKCDLECVAPPLSLIHI